MKTLKQIVQVVVVLLISGLEPFWPAASPTLALAAVLGTKYPNSTGIFAAVFIGLARDALLVNRLGGSSLIAAFAWFIAAFAASRLGRPLVVSIIAAGLASLAVAIDYRFILATAALAGIFSAVWNFISDRDDKIMVRKV